MEEKRLHVENLCVAFSEELCPYIQGGQTNMRSPVGVLKKVACTLYNLSDEGRLRKTANAFGLSLLTVCYCQANVQSHLCPPNSQNT